MPPAVEDEVNRYYSELNLKEPAIKNPFTHRVQISRWQKKLEIALGFIFLFPLRLLIGIPLFTFAGIWCYAVTLGWNPPDLRTPLTPWRRKLKNCLPAMIRSLLFVLGFHKIKIKGKLASPSEAPLTVIAPHSSFLDILLLCEYGSAPSGVSKIENLQSPILGPYLSYSVKTTIIATGKLQDLERQVQNVTARLQSLEVIGVSRDNTKSRQVAVKELQYRAVTTRGQWPHVCIFPEGTCTNRKSLISFKNGAFIPGCPVQPVCLRFPEQPDVYTWTWDGPGGVILTILLLCQLNNVAEIEFLPVWNPTEEEKENPELYAERVQQSMARCLNVPVTGHSFEDTLLMAAATKHGLPPETGVIEFTKTATKLGLNLDSVKEHLKRFAALDSDEDGQISLQDFALHYKLPISSPVKELFSIFDRESNGVINFRQYLVGSVCLVRLAAKKEIAESALKILQEYSKPNNKQVLPDGNIEDILKRILQIIDNTNYENHNVRSRNEEFQEFLSCYPELTTLLSTLLPNKTSVDNHPRESILI